MSYFTLHRKLAVSSATPQAPCSRNNKLDFKKLTGYISAQKRKGASFDEAMEQASAVAKVFDWKLAYKQYETSCRKEGWLDFDSMLIEAVRLLETNKEVRDKYQFKFTLVDEAQDTDDIQWRLVKLVSERYGNVFAVGDEEQLIYEWRGAEADGLYCKIPTKISWLQVHLSISELQVH